MILSFFKLWHWNECSKNGKKTVTRNGQIERSIGKSSVDTFRGYTFNPHSVAWTLITMFLLAQFLVNFGLLQQMNDSIKWRYLFISIHNENSPYCRCILHQTVCLLFLRFSIWVIGLNWSSLTNLFPKKFISVAIVNQAFLFIISTWTWNKISLFYTILI